MHLADLKRARRHFEAAIEWYQGVNRADALHAAFEFGLELGVPTYGFAAWCLWLLGYPEQAFQLGNEALATAERIPHDYTRSRGFYYDSVLHAFRREWTTVESRAAAAIAWAQERGHAMVAAVCGIMQASAQAMLAPREEFVAEIRQGISGYRATGARTQGTCHLVLLAQALVACGRHGEGLAALREAAAFAEETGERFVEAEIHRIEGNLRLAANGAVEAEACYLRALELAQVQRARSLELRAAADLARLWAERGERARAADLLAPVYGWFSEGFDTPDLKDAKALVDDLA